MKPCIVIAMPKYLLLNIGLRVCANTLSEQAYVLKQKAPLTRRAQRVRRA